MSVVDFSIRQCPIRRAVGNRVGKALFPRRNGSADILVEQFDVFDQWCRDTPFAHVANHSVGCESVLSHYCDISYNRWREYDVEDTVRFYALRLQEIGMIKSAPDQIIKSGTNWQFFNELKQELKA